MRHYIIIGSSRGLGASLVEEFLSKGWQVSGVARTDPSAIPGYGKWLETTRYQHIKSDIASPECRDKLSAICANLPHEPICIVYNSAFVQSDICKDGSIDYGIFEEVNRVQIDGLGNTLRAFEKHLSVHGGIFVGISSFSAFAPPFFEPRIAYPASKAYLDMALRCLGNVWGDKVKVVTIHLGHMSDGEKTFFGRWTVPTYSMTARKITNAIMGTTVPKEINYPFLHCIVYKYFLMFIPDTVYLFLFKAIFKLLQIQLPEKKHP